MAPLEMTALELSGKVPLHSGAVRPAKLGAGAASRTGRCCAWELFVRQRASKLLGSKPERSRTVSRCKLLGSEPASSRRG